MLKNRLLVFGAFILPFVLFAGELDWINKYMADKSLDRNLDFYAGPYECSSFSREGPGKYDSIHRQKMMAVRVGPNTMKISWNERGGHKEIIRGGLVRGPGPWGRERVYKYASAAENKSIHVKFYTAYGTDRNLAINITNRQEKLIASCADPLKTN